MKRFFSLKTQGFYHTGIQTTIPNDAVGITESQYDLLYGKLSSGFKVFISDSGEFCFKEAEDFETVETERMWRDRELIRADIELFKVQDSDPKSTGTVAQWREYRKALRDYPESKNFPSISARPVRPDA